jgi:hypothetical protein
MVPKNNCSAAFMLKVQHIPWSVGHVEKMAEHGTCCPFHSQYLRIEFSSDSLQGIPEFQNVDRNAG